MKFLKASTRDSLLWEWTVDRTIRLRRSEGVVLHLAPVVPGRQTRPRVADAAPADENHRAVAGNLAPAAPPLRTLIKETYIDVLDDSVPLSPIPSLLLPVLR